MITYKKGMTLFSATPHDEETTQAAQDYCRTNKLTGNEVKIIVTTNDDGVKSTQVIAHSDFTVYEGLDYLNGG